jgi:hypothetical protein
MSAERLKLKILLKPLLGKRDKHTMTPGVVSPTAKQFSDSRSQE